MEVKEFNSKDFRIYKNQIYKFIFKSMISNNNKNSVEIVKNKFDKLSEILSKKKGFIYAVINDNKLLAFIYAYKSAFRDDEKRLYIDIIYVQKKYRNRGIGTLLIKKLEAKAKILCLDRIYLSIDASDRKLIDFLDKRGYKFERIQLLKDNLILQQNYVKKSENLTLISSEFVKSHLEEITNLFFLNSQAHVYTKSHNIRWSKEKIKDLPGYIDEEKAIVIGHIIDEKLIGFAWIFPYEYCDEERYFLNALIILPDYRKRHIASQIFEYMETLICSKNKKLYTFVDACNISAYHFYLKNGFKHERLQLVKNVHTQLITNI